MGRCMNINHLQRVSVGLVAFVLGTPMLSQRAQGQTEQVPAASSAKPDQQSERSGGTQSDDPSYVIGDDDVLAINVWNEPDLKQSVPVRPDGKISLPLLGDITAAGRTPSQLQEDIAAKLKAYVTHPNVTVVVQQILSKKFNILGRVMKPGAYPLSKTTTVLDAIALAGGFQDFAKQKDVYILRDNPGGDESRLRFNYKDVIKGKNREQNIKLEPNDTIVVP